RLVCLPRHRQNSSVTFTESHWWCPEHIRQNPSRAPSGGAWSRSFQFASHKRTISICFCRTGVGDLTLAANCVDRSAGIFLNFDSLKGSESGRDSPALGPSPFPDPPPQNSFHAMH